MSSTHRLHPIHTGRAESDAVAVSLREHKCSSCREPLSPIEKPPFHCNQCDYTVCSICHKPKRHPVHPNHDVYLKTPTLAWRCDVCKRRSSDILDKSCYHCEQCDFHVCKDCVAAVNSQLHVHPLHRTDVRFVYHHSNGEWNCDACRNNNGPGHFYPAHCQLCEFDLCDNCIKPYKSSAHEGHLLYKADSNVTYPRFNGGWRCDRCSRSFIPQMNNLPFHCSQCEFDLCENCMNSTAELSNAVGFDVSIEALQGGNRGPSPLTARGNPIASPSEEVEQVGRSGAPVDVGDCVICLERPKDATIVHGDTGHVCCCMSCATELYRRGENCPICRAPIQVIIRQYTV